MRKFYLKRHDLTVEDSCLFYKHKLFIPQSLQKQVLSELHSTHLGVEKMKSLARSYFFWHHIDREIEQLTKNCKICLLH